MRTILFACGLLATLAAGAQNVTVPRGVTAAMNRIDTNTIRGHVAYLADDRLRGRLPGTEGYQLAVDYVSSQFRSLRIAPGGDAGAYTQRLVIRKSTLVNASAVAVLRDEQGNTDSLVLGRDFTPEAHPLRERTAAEGRPVFAGYGMPSRAAIMITMVSTSAARSWCW
ncbi:hypothetical protein [Flaviaesturariibacter flavus]|uniref:hypothetical protein n=1 Tax=Flaviaesturariibacter flavus TaxID=2502780 RepID=UPI001A9D8BB3|nr:hypothetical protein [Flaviaesturariibacter flavus]